MYPLVYDMWGGSISTLLVSIIVLINLLEFLHCNLRECHSAALE
jgi:hypothetical protein